MTPKTPILKTEAHLHLYGCLSAEDLWTIGKDRYQKLSTRMEWFAKEYELVFKQSPDWRSWWDSENGFDDFKKAFLFTKPGPFPEFQAKFNLLIALNPPTPGEYGLIKSVLAGHQSPGGTKEYRTFLPMYLSETDREAYLQGLLEEVRSQTSTAFQPLIALSLVRTPEVCEPAYLWLQHFCERHPWTVSYLTGIDFCASEHGHPPKLKRELIRRFYDENAKNSRPWHVLYHVGEMWDQISLASAARWVVESCQYGVKRVGHGMALGVEPAVLLGQSTIEPIGEFRDHLAWLETNKNLLNDFGYTTKDREWWKLQGEAATQNDLVTWSWSAEHCEHLRHFQNALLRMTQIYQPLLEVCVTSNMRIGSLRTFADHPLKRFLAHDLQVCASTDDPGIFEIDLMSEENILASEYGCDESRLRSFEQNASHWVTGLKA